MNDTEFANRMVQRAVRLAETNVKMVWKQCGGNTDYVLDMRLGDFLDNCIRNDVSFDFKYEGDK